MKSNYRRIISLAAIAALALPMWAQEAKSGSKAKSQEPGMGMTVPRPSPEMNKLIKLMQGNWTVEEKLEPGPMSPKGGTGKGTASLSPGPGGMSLMEKYHSSGTMAPSFSGAGTFWWDSKAQGYRGVWCDSMTPDGCDASAVMKWEGDKLTGTMKGEMGGKTMFSRYTYMDFKPDSFVMTMEVGATEKSMQKSMTITYSKGPAPKIPAKP